MFSEKKKRYMKIFQFEVEIRQVFKFISFSQQVHSLEKWPIRPFQFQSSQLFVNLTKLIVIFYISYFSNSLQRISFFFQRLNNYTEHACSVFEHTRLSDQVLLCWGYNLIPMSFYWVYSLSFLRPSIFFLGAMTSQMRSNKSVAFFSLSLSNKLF